MIFDEKLAVAVGINEAIILQHLADGPVARSYAEWSQHLPWLSERYLRRLLPQMVSRGLLTVNGPERGVRTWAAQSGPPGADELPEMVRQTPTEAAQNGQQADPNGQQVDQSGTPLDQNGQPEAAQNGQPTTDIPSHVCSKESTLGTKYVQDSAQLPSSAHSNCAQLESAQIEQTVVPSVPVDIRSVEHTKVEQTKVEQTEKDAQLESAQLGTDRRESVETETVETKGDPTQDVTVVGLVQDGKVVGTAEAWKEGDGDADHHRGLTVHNRADDSQPNETKPKRKKPAKKSAPTAYRATHYRAFDWAAIKRGQWPENEHPHSILVGAYLVVMAALDGNDDRAFTDRDFSGKYGKLAKDCYEHFLALKQDPGEAMTAALEYLKWFGEVEDQWIAESGRTVEICFSSSVYGSKYQNRKIAAQAPNLSARRGRGALSTGDRAGVVAGPHELKHRKVTRKRE